MIRRLCLVILLVLALPASAAAAADRKKSIWGPTQIGSESAFPIYADLGVGIFQMPLHWHVAAPTRPTDPTDPADPAYRWPPDVDYAITEAARHGIRVSLMLSYAPSWANGNRDPNWAPLDPRDFADFATAASRRYPAVNHWLIWGEPSRRANFMPLAPARRFKPLRRPLTRRQARAPRRYARILDEAYGALKAVNPSNVVIGGNTFTAGDILPLDWLRALRLPGGRRPRMDLYGHNPFSGRKPALRKPDTYPGVGFVDFSDLDTLAAWLDRYFPRRRRPLRLFLSEFTIPTDHPNNEFNFYVTRRAQADWVAAALRITRRWSRIYTLGWFGLMDEPPNGPNGTAGNAVNRGLMDWRGRPKPAYFAFKRG